MGVNTNGGSTLLGDGLQRLAAAGKQAANSKVLSIFYAQNQEPEGWVPTDATPNTSLSSGELAQWVEDLAYDAWLALPVTKMESDQLYSFVPPGVFGPSACSDRPVLIGLSVCSDLF